MALSNIVLYSQLQNSRRLDSQFYTPELLHIRELLGDSPQLRLKTKRITDFGAYSQMNFVEYKESGIRFLRNQDVGEIIINNTEPIFIDCPTYEKLSLKLQEGDVILPRVGTLGKSAIITEDILPCSANQNLAQIQTKGNLSPYYLSVFLSTRFGLLQVFALATGNVQPWLNLQQIGRIKVFVPSSKFQGVIDDLCISAIDKDKVSTQMYSQAKQLLLSELGLLNWKPSYALAYVRNYSQVARVRRMDAEYFQPVYQAMFNRLSSSVRIDRLSKLITYTKGIEVGSSVYADAGIPFWRVSNLTKYGLDDSSLNCISEELYNSLRLDFEPQLGEILLSKDATPGIAYYLDRPIQGIASSGIVRLTIINDIPPHYLELALNSLFVQLQVARDAGGSIIKHWRPSEVRKTLIPRLSPAREIEIAGFVQQSHAARREAKTLLNKSKRAVEIAIEEGEAKALEFINSSEQTPKKTP